MLQILYIIAFSFLLLFAIGSLVRSMITLSQRQAEPVQKTVGAIHPELLDGEGNLTEEPLLVIKTLDLDAMRSRLDALYEASPGGDNNL
ncbi:MAG: DUF2973 domain-containing protein [Pseudanabaenaceae cyanobacterium SKYGB_i_bin29]|nr:DUF2973 domain-containing protein [Pseudanabaenaceae cyanobacterium SKYG29]MDW8420632.1 DUF2973 domain-containing protein [Pseudanabaenaceae cyanobacterium SKYGB_i_bin29]